MKKILVIFIILLNIKLYANINLDKSAINSGNKIESSYILNLFSTIENSINELFSKQEKTEVFFGTINLSSKQDIENNDGGDAKFDQVKNTNTDVFEIDNTSGFLKIKKAGIITFHYNQDVQQTCTYFWLYAILIDHNNGNSEEDMGRSLINASAHPLEWDGISISNSYPVPANSSVKFKMGCAGLNPSNGIEVFRIDGSPWGNMSVKWTGVL